MITLIHGDNTLLSRNQLNLLKNSAADREIVVIDSRNNDQALITGALESPSISGRKKLVIFENIITRLGRKINLIKDFISLLVRNIDTADAVVWEGREMTPSVLNQLGSHGKIMLFKTPKVIFQFLDGLVPNQGQKMLFFYEQIAEPAEMVFSMLIKRVRSLLLLKSGGKLPAVQAWQASRLTTQSKFFTMEQLQDLYQKLYRLEVTDRSGESALDLKSLLRLLLINL